MNFRELRAAYLVLETPSDRRYLTVRNVYISFEFGTFVRSSSNAVDPFIPLLATTNMTQAHLDFVATRQNGGGQSSGTGQGSANSNNSAAARTGINGLRCLYMMLAGFGLASML